MLSPPFVWLTERVDLRSEFCEAFNQPF